MSSKTEEASSSSFWNVLRNARISTKITAVYAVILFMLLAVGISAMALGVYYAFYHQAEIAIDLSEQQTVAKLEAGADFTPSFWNDDPVLPGVVLRVTDITGRIVFENDSHFPSLQDIEANTRKRPPFWANQSMDVADIGNYISQDEHYHHSYYVLKANPIIGLSDKENTIIAELARYHSAEAPRVEQHHYNQLPPDVQMRMAKLVAIVRIADALDDSHQQKISKLTVSLRDNELRLTAYSTQDLALEEWAFANKAKLFYEVYGIKAVLKQRRSEA